MAAHCRSALSAYGPPTREALVNSINPVDRRQKNLRLKSGSARVSKTAALACAVDVFFFELRLQNPTTYDAHRSRFEACQVFFAGDLRLRRMLLAGASCLP